MPRVYHDCVASCVCLVCLCARPTAYRPCSAPIRLPPRVQPLCLLSEEYSLVLRRRSISFFLLPSLLLTPFLQFRKQTIVRNLLSIFFHLIVWSNLQNWKSDRIRKIVIEWSTNWRMEEAGGGGKKISTRKRENIWSMPFWITTTSLRIYQTWEKFRICKKISNCSKSADFYRR